MWNNTVNLSMNVPPETVYAFQADFLRVPEWSESVETMELMAGAPNAVGSEYKTTENCRALW